MARQHTTLDPVTLPDGSSVSMLQASVGTRPGVRFQSWDVCVICGIEFPKSELVYVKGVPYCTKYRDYLEA